MDTTIWGLAGSRSMVANVWAKGSKGSEHFDSAGLQETDSE